MGRIVVIPCNVNYSVITVRGSHVHHENTIAACPS